MDGMDLFLTLLSGIGAGILAKFFVPGVKGMSFVEVVLLGIGGSIFGGLFLGLLGFSNVGFLGAVVGAVILLYVYKKFFRETVMKKLDKS